MSTSEITDTGIPGARTPKPVADGILSPAAMMAVATLGLFGTMREFGYGFGVSRQSDYRINVALAEALDLAGYAELTLDQPDSERMRRRLLTLTDDGRALLREALP